jgi:hypothetical protein
MNTSNSNEETHKVMLRIVDVVAQKSEGYTVVVELPPDADITSEEMWKIALPGNFQGATRVSDLWHLYYGEKPPFSAGDTFEVKLPGPSSGRADADKRV